MIFSVLLLKKKKKCCQKNSHLLTLCVYARMSLANFLEMKFLDQNLYIFIFDRAYQICLPKKVFTKCMCSHLCHHLILLVFKNVCHSYKHTDIYSLVFSCFLLLVDRGSFTLNIYMHRSSQKRSETQKSNQTHTILTKGERFKLQGMMYCGPVTGKYVGELMEDEDYFGKVCFCKLISVSAPRRC